MRAPTYRQVLALTLVSLGSAPAWADPPKGGNIDLQAFRFATDSRGYITVNASQILGHKELSIGLLGTMGHRVLEFEMGKNTYTVENVVTVTPQVAFGLFKIVELGLTFPFTLVSGDAGPDDTGPNPDIVNDDQTFGFDAQGLGDAGLHAKVRLLNTSKHPMGLAITGSVFMPLGYDADKWLGENAVTVQPGVVVDKEWERVKLAANVGVRIRSGDHSFTDTGPPMTGTAQTITAKTEIPFGVAAAFAVSKQRFDLLAEVFGGLPLGGEEYFPLEAVGGAKLYLAKNSFFLIGAGAGLLGGASGGNPDLRAFLGIVYEPNIGDRDGDGIKDDVDQCPDDPEDYDDFEDRDGCPEPDNDRDGLLDEDDKCPNEPEDKDGIDDEDGCPEADDLDRDGDGILDAADNCPDDPEDKDKFQDEDGCPEPDNDQDGILDVDDLCINDPEDKDDWEDKDGCPDPDNDKDRILDKADQCPNEPETYNGTEDEDGCPDRGRVVVTSGAIEILDKIYFETNKAIIKPESFAILDAIAATLVGNPDILLIEIGGHADERNDDEYNMRLTQDRADAVKKYLVDKGVEASRLGAVGYGETRPIDKRHNEDAWSKNRRVEFLILKRAGQP
jgi:outer membrane protein OmpA-like peptidoglycan-associated protein